MKNKQKKSKKSYLYIILLALAFIILLGTYAYPNRYGIPCEFITLFPDLGNDALFLGSKTIDFTFDDGTAEVADYTIWPIKIALAE